MTAGSVDLVLAVGNLLLQDDAVGLRLLEMLPREDGVDYIDGGTQGLALLPYLDGRRSIVVLDAIKLGAAPGTVHVIKEFASRRATTAHESNAMELLATARMLGYECGEVTVVGIEPAKIATGIGLSPEVEAALPQAVARTIVLCRPRRPSPFPDPHHPIPPNVPQLLHRPAGPPDFDPLRRRV